MWSSLVVRSEHLQPPGQSWVLCHLQEALAAVLLCDGRVARVLVQDLVVIEDLLENFFGEYGRPPAGVPGVVFHDLVPYQRYVAPSEDPGGQHQSPDGKLGGEQQPTLRGEVRDLDEVLCEVVCHGRGGHEFGVAPKEGEGIRFPELVVQQSEDVHLFLADLLDGVRVGCYVD